ncbi:peptidylprolyl isomerase [Salinisphaera sp. LB1]|uniref:peptidylprolyl isomerase n=1 Tax=Salinisphaera sp. LB1 TaxID=2183911 RepID=UPI000D708399|nr:peptidylprolyl isomerase [Salinisphaera sp. LB1]AWN14224.1 Peptidyl-prolyl cis-trans isomerase PpiD [Salinisphaera sp. LB1]
MLAMVNRVVLPEHHINAESGEVESGTIDEKRAEAIRRLAVKELLRQRARAIGIKTERRLDAAIDELLAVEVEVPEATDETCRRYFDANRERFCTPVTVDMAHILLAAAPDDPEGRADARERADALIEQLQTKPERFAELARAHSHCPSAAAGGALGWIGRGQTVPELESVVLRMDAGVGGRPVETRYGYHIVRVDDRRGGAPLAYVDVQAMIADYLHDRSWRRAISQYVRVLASEAELSGVELETVDNPLVQ